MIEITRSGKMPHRSPEVWRTACQDMARRAQGGTLIYPFAVALLGVGSDRQGAFPTIFLALLALVTLLALFRFFLSRRFEQIYDRDPRRWAIAFFGGALATCAAFSGL